MLVGCQTVYVNGIRYSWITKYCYDIWFLVMTNKVEEEIVEINLKN